MSKAKLHYASFKGCTLLDIVPAVDKVQKHTEKHCLCEVHLRRAAALLQAFRVYTQHVEVRVVPDCAPPWAQYPLPVTVLVMGPEGGYARREDAPEYQESVRHKVYTVKAWGGAPIPPVVLDLERVANTDRWEA